MSYLSGKTALVTGASRGIGRASSRLISRAACARHVVTVRRRRAARTRSRGGRASP